MDNNINKSAMFIVHSNIHMELISTHVVRFVSQKQVCSLCFPSW